EWDTYALLGLPGGLWRGIVSLLLMSAQALLVAAALWVAIRKRADVPATGPTTLAPASLP
ncbi:MAG: hypothetical protein HYX89_01955, partial [Chloroflexi bacterium]|nr:hypothetical protein [Chloroflexota bacterium]